MVPASAGRRYCSMLSKILGISHSIGAFLRHAERASRDAADCGQFGEIFNLRFCPGRFEAAAEAAAVPSPTVLHQVSIARLLEPAAGSNWNKLPL